MIAAQPVLHESYRPGVVDAHGKVVDGWAEPVERLVFGWAQTGSDEPRTVGKDRVVVDLEMFSPWPAGHRDRVTVAGSRYLVEGASADWDHGPFGYAPGFVFALRRVDG